MVHLRFRDDIRFEATEFPLGSARIELDLELTSDDVPEVAYQRFVTDVLQKLSDHAAEGKALAKAVATESAAAPATPKIDPAETADEWEVPGNLHLKTVKTAHRFVVAAAALAEQGPAPTLAEIGEKARLSGPPISKVVNPKTDAGRYVAPLIKVRKEGRSKRVDVTPLGRKVASLVRAGKLPM